MKIGINARFLAKPFTGIGQVTINLFKELAKLDSQNEYIFVVHEEINPNIISEFPKNIQIVILPEKKYGSAGMKKTWWEQISLPDFFVKNGVNVAIFPYASNPWTNDWYKKAIKTVLIIHDCIPWTNKDYRGGILSKMYHHQTKKAAKKADVIFTVSETSKKEIANVCDIKPEKIHVIYNDCSEIYKRFDDVNFAKKVLEKFELKENGYFLYVGGYDDRKNVDYLISEYINFRKKFRDDIPLVLTGDKLFNSDLYSSYDNSGGVSGIVKTGFLDEKTLAVLYSKCLAFINLSKYEGFNIPVIEAANCHAPIILSDIPVHVEIVGEKNALFVDINEMGEGERALKRILDESIWKNLKEKSLIIAKKYSWESSAQIFKDMVFSK